MFLKRLYLRHFRNYAEAEISFSPQINVFYGDNAQGKTNILEAIYLIATGRSFRSQRLSELIRQGESFFFLEAEIVQGGISQRIKASFDGQNRQLQIDGNSYSSFHPLLGILPSVLYTPQDTEFIDGSPAVRRRFLNLHLAQSDPLYVHHLTRFWRAMKQRNCLLRAQSEASLDCWEMEMASSADYIAKTRQEMIDSLQKMLQEQSLKKESYEIQLQLSQGKNYLQQLQKNRRREREFGLTLTGPHRDDLNFFIDKNPARIFASEGQKKTALAALRFAEWERLRKQVDGPALMGIDDLGLHLDEQRQTLLRGSLERLGQVFVTIPYLPSTWKELAGGLHLQVQNGSINPSSK